MLNQHVDTAFDHSRVSPDITTTSIGRTMSALVKVWMHYLKR